MSKAKLTDAERNVMASFWHDGLDGSSSGRDDFWPILLWQTEEWIEDSEFFDMMSVMAKELESEGKNEVDRPIYPVEIPWADAGEFRRRLRALLADVPGQPGSVS